MKKIFLLSIIGLFLLTVGNSHAIQMGKSAHLLNTGEILGVVEGCGEGELNGGAMVYIPGLSIMAISDNEGAFRLLYVPVGVYDVVVEVNGEEPVAITDVTVARGAVTDLGVTIICSGCFDNSDCPEDSFCSPRFITCSFGTCVCGEVGQCRKRPELCMDVYDPVCGCDGNTYNNGCLAKLAGTTMAQRGECDLGPVECSDSSDCGPGYFCNKPDGQCSAEGVCEKLPVNMGCLYNYDPVCGCDGTTYPNSCEAWVNGVNISYDGSCIIRYPPPRPIPQPPEPPVVIWPVPEPSEPPVVTLPVPEPSEPPKTTFP